MISDVIAFVSNYKNRIQPLLIWIKWPLSQWHFLFWKSIDYKDSASYFGLFYFTVTILVYNAGSSAYNLHCMLCWLRNSKVLLLSSSQRSEKIYLLYIYLSVAFIIQIFVITHKYCITKKYGTVTVSVNRILFSTVLLLQWSGLSGQPYSMYSSVFSPILFLQLQFNALHGSH